jgi:hypothetical protein
MHTCFDGRIEDESIVEERRSWLDRGQVIALAVAVLLGLSSAGSWPSRALHIALAVALVVVLPVLRALLERIAYARQPAGTVSFRGRATLYIDHDVAGPLLDGLPSALRLESRATAPEGVSANDDTATSAEEVNSVWAKGMVVLDDRGITWVPSRSVAEAGVTRLRIPWSRLAGVDIDYGRFGGWAESLVVVHVDDEASFALELSAGPAFADAIQKLHSEHHERAVITALSDAEKSLWGMRDDVEIDALVRPSTMTTHWRWILLFGWIVTALCLFGPFGAMSPDVYPTWVDLSAGACFLLGAVSLGLAAVGSRRAPVVSLAGAVFGFVTSFADIGPAPLLATLELALFAVLLLVSEYARTAERESHDFF